MKKDKQRILFFTPFATRTGSEMMLLYILQQIDRSRFDVGIVSFANGELLKEFPSDIPVFIAPRKYNLTQKIMFHLGNNPTLNYLRKVAKEFKADFWYINTTVLPEVFTVAREFPVKIITHFHELPLTYAYLSRNDMENIITRSDLLIGCSQVTCKAIEQAGGNNVALLYEFIDTGKVVPQPDRTAQLRAELGIPQNDYIWVLSGMTSERKGFDLLPDIAEELDDAQVHLIWVGNIIDDGLVYYIQRRCSNNKSKTRIHLVGKQKEDYYNYLDMGNGFLLTSRQDPFPLVMIEAALLSKPIVSFPSGGASEFIQEGMGFITEDISVKQMVQGMRKVMSGEIVTVPEKSKNRAAAFNVKNGYEQWIEIIDKM
ncbi:glycosyltransferase [Dyadobacter psychrotolerans]|uniref:Glycosyltransferase n=1 Tax=Dyadobacter psychrotolerans TaxID=2541721 RepID=A0A4R5DGY5_9BACT|nr:glycosyltransferase [Dyadobacter psychrotolerans]TDE12487.1 glycosyltransferase [Dyadobacter psychrotolerans]